MKRGRGSSSDVEIEIHFPPETKLPSAWALAIAMYESKDWCHYVELVRNKHEKSRS